MSTTKEPSAARERRRLGEMLAIAALAVGLLAVVVVQPRLAEQVKKVKAREDVSALPPPKQLKVMALGYKQATVDLLWAKMIVEWGLAHHEKRAFPDLVRYIDAILEIEPDFSLIYTFVDTLIVYGPTPGTAEDARLARSYLRRGTQERKFDPDVWLHYGQFCAFLAPTFLKDPAEIDEFRKEGALALMRAVELGSDPDRSLSAATILKKSGEKKALREQLRRAYALADDPETQRNILFKLGQLEDSPEGEEAVDIVNRVWRQSYPFLSRHMALLVGPSRVQSACVGGASFDTRRCPRDWTVAIERQ